jgi:hypothetical protein
MRALIKLTPAEVSALHARIDEAERLVIELRIQLALVKALHRDAMARLDAKPVTA